jgi:phage-related minor tail protein
MPPFKDSFQDRVGQAAEAKRKALEKLKAKPPVDPEVAATRLEAARQREARAEEKRSAKAEKARAAEEARAAEQAKIADAAASAPRPPTEAERKAARDARYAARKSRK